MFIPDMTLIREMIAAWNRLMPMLGSQISEDLRKNFLLAGVPLSPKPSMLPASYSPASASFLPTGAGWGPAPASASASAPPAAPIAAAPPPPPASTTPFVPRPSTP